MKAETDIPASRSRPGSNLEPMRGVPVPESQRGQSPWRRIGPVPSIVSFPPDLTSANKESPDMKRALFSLMTLIVLAALTGCVTQRGRHPLLASGGNCGDGGSCAQATEGCQADCAACEAPCDDVGCLQKLRARLCKDRTCKAPCEEPVAAAGPATGAVTYPYYTTRGPRDFYAKSPRSIGP